MSLFKREDSPYFWVKLSVRGGEPVQRGTKTTVYKQAKEFEQKLATEPWQQKQLGVKRRYRGMEAVLKYLKESSHLSTQDTDKFHLCWLRLTSGWRDA